MTVTHKLREFVRGGKVYEIGLSSEAIFGGFRATFFIAPNSLTNEDARADGFSVLMRDVCACRFEMHRNGHRRGPVYKYAAESDGTRGMRRRPRHLSTGKAPAGTPPSRSARGL